jgi:hypothetical protein
MSWSEMVANVERLLIADGSETELDALLTQLQKVLPNSGILDLIYYPDKPRSAEDIVNEAILQQNRVG